VILTAEEIVPPLEKINLIGPLTDVLVPAPGGARPTSCHPLYPLDGEALLAYSGQVSDPQSFNAFLDGWLDS